MLTLHHLENSRSQRILWLLEELEVAYEIKRYARDPKTKLAPPELEAIHPLGKSPVITDGDIVVAESGAIIEYLVKNHGNGKLKPADDTEAGRLFTYWLHFAEGSFMPFMVLTLILHRIETAKVPFFVKPIAKGIADEVRKGYVGPNVKRSLTFIEAHLGKHTWFCGDEMTAADMQMSFPLQAAAGRGMSGHPNITAFLKRIEALPAYKRAIEKGGPFDPLGT